MNVTLQSRTHHSNIQPHNEGQQDFLGVGVVCAFSLSDSDFCKNNTLEMKEIFRLGLAYAHKHNCLTFFYVSLFDMCAILFSTW